MYRTLLHRLVCLACFSALVLMLVSCGANQSKTSNSLYDKLGGKTGIETLTTALLERVYADDRIAFLFQDADRENLHELIVEQICMEAGGPCEYTGLPMDEGHSGLQIKHSEFDAFVEDFILAMQDVGLSYRTQNRVLAIFAPMRDEIVYQ